MMGPNGCCEDCGVNEDEVRFEVRIEGWRRFRDDLQAVLGASSYILQSMFPGIVPRFTLSEVSEAVEKMRMPMAEWDRSDVLSDEERKGFNSVDVSSVRQP